MTQRRGVRASTAKAFLKPVMNRTNLRVITQALAKRLLLQGKRVTGVEFWQDGELCVAEARHEVILAAGSIASPQLLQVSGIGPGTVLREHGIEVRHELPGVGENLHDHLMERTVYKVRNTRTLNERLRSKFGQFAIGLEYVLFRTGPMSVIPPQLCIFAKSDPSRETANIQLQAAAFSFDKPGDPPHPFPAFTVWTNNLRPTSRGHIRIKNADTHVYPKLFHNYLATADDQRVAIDILRIMRKIAGASALKRYAPEEYLPGVAVESDDAILQYIRNTATTVYHPAGTCKMGHDDLAVVDDRLRVRGVEGLRVVDCSIMPTLTSGNTNAPTIMIAEKASDMIKADGRVAARAAA